MPRRMLGLWARLVDWGNRNSFFVGLILAGLIVSGGYWRLEMSDSDLQQVADRADARAACLTDVTYDAIKATNERTTYSEELSTANENQLRAFQALVIAALQKPPPGEKEAREIVVNYRDALDAYFKVSAKASAKRENFPYPTAAEVKACR